MTTLATTTAAADSLAARTLAELRESLAGGHLRSRDIVDAALENALDPSGEGQRVFVRVNVDVARAMADACDSLRVHGVTQGPLAGIPVSIKDLFDVAGEPTTAGSLALAEAPPAAEDAAAVARLRAAGAIFIGRTNMAEFAYGGVGTNPHYGTPLCVWDRATGRVPGGSSSGAAISVTDGMAAVAIGTDTGGSCRIPAALNGIVGFKPTAHRVPRTGVFPLSPSQDCVGPLGRTVACCALVDAILAGEAPTVPAAMPMRGLRLAVPKTLVLEDLDPTVAAVFARTLSRLSEAGAVIEDVRLGDLEELADPFRRHAIAAVEAWQIHRHLLATKRGLYDPNVTVRIDRGAELSGADYIDLLNWRRDLSARLLSATFSYDAWALPTVPIVAPRLADVQSAEGYRKHNILLLRNTAVGNFLDTPTISLPCHEPGEAPVGLMLMGAPGQDRRVLAMARGIETLLAR